MKKLSLEEISKIPDLLLSPNEANKELAIQLLEQHPYAISSILAPVEIFLVFHLQSKFWSSIKRALPKFKVEESPIYVIYLIQNGDYYSDTASSVLRRFSINELNYRTWLLQDPEKAVIYANIGELFGQHESLLDKGVEYYELAINHGARHTSITLDYLALLQKKYTLNNTLEAHKLALIDHYNQAYLEHPHQDILYNLASFYQNHLKDIEAIMAAWERCIQAYPKFNRAFFVYAQFLVAEKKWTSAKKVAEQSLTLALSGSYYNLDEIYYLLGGIEWNGFKEYSTAEKYFEKALEENEFYFQPLEALMELSLENEDYTKAIRWHKIALKEIPFDISLMLKLAELYLKIYDLEQAAHYYTEILELNAAYPPALEGLKKIEQL